MKSRYFETPEEAISHVYHNSRTRNSASITNIEIELIIKQLRKVSEELFKDSSQFSNLVENLDSIEKLSLKYFKERMEKFSKEEEERKIKIERKEELDKLNAALDSL